MSVQTTSKIAYSEISSEGIRSKQSDKVLGAVSQKGSSLKEISRDTGIEINAVSGRVNELRKRGYLTNAPRRKCSITGRLITPVMGTTI